MSPLALETTGMPVALPRLLLTGLCGGIGSLAKDDDPSSFWERAGKHDLNGSS